MVSTIAHVVHTQALVRKLLERNHHAIRNEIKNDDIAVFVEVLAKNMKETTESTTYVSTALKWNP